MLYEVITGTSLDGYYTIAANGQINITAVGVTAGVAQNDRNNFV